MRKVVILGAGPTGLVLARELAGEFEVVVLEKERYIGGLSSSFDAAGMTLDFGPHKFFSQIEGIDDYFKSVVGEDALVVRKRNSVRLFGRYFTFPVHAASLLKSLNVNVLWQGLKIGVGYLAGIPAALRLRNPANFEEFLVKGFGRAGYAAFFRDIAVKLWGEPTSLSVDLARKRVPVSSIPQLVRSVLVRKVDKNVSADFFHYPRLGFIQFLRNLQRQAEARGASFVLGAKVDRLALGGGRATVAARDHLLEADLVISTIPLKAVVESMKDCPPEVQGAANRLRYRSLAIVYLVIERERVLKDNWIFFLQGDTFINRAAELKSFSSAIFPDGMTAVTVEITRDDVLRRSDEELKAMVLDEIEMLELMPRDAVRESIVRRFDDVYPVYDLTYKANLGLVLDHLDAHENFYTIGRAGLFNYNNVDHCVDMALKLSAHLKAQGSKGSWKRMYPYFDTYRIVD